MKQHIKSKSRGFIQSIAQWQKHVIWILILVIGIPLTSNAEITAGGYTMTRLSAPYMSNPMKARAGVASIGFCGKVGGVAFGEIAESTDGSQIQRLLYHPDRPDGMRLEALVKHGDELHNITLPVYDWQFIPTARFAAGEQDAVLTFFGDLSDAEKEATLREQGCRFINYHPAIDNTLMGLRLMQADLLAFHRTAPYDLKKNGVNIVGQGETLQAESKNHVSSAKVQAYWHYATGQHGAQSYVICDVGQPIRFHLQSASEGKKTLVLSGYPFWSCWTAPVDTDALQNRVLMQALENLTASEQMQLMRAMQEDEEVPPPIERKIRRFVEQNFGSMLEQEREKTFRRLPEVSTELSRLIKEEEGGNPVVYRALTTFMRYAALFRHAREYNPSGYEAFVQSLSDIRLVPPIETPTVIMPPKQSITPE